MTNNKFEDSWRGQSVILVLLCDELISQDTCWGLGTNIGQGWWYSTHTHPDLASLLPFVGASMLYLFNPYLWKQLPFVNVRAPGCFIVSQNNVGKNPLLPLHRISFSHYSGNSIPTIMCYGLIFIYALPFLIRLPLLPNTVHWQRKITVIKIYLERFFFQIPGKQSEHICCRLEDSLGLEFQKACNNIIAVFFRKHYIRDTF